MKVKLILFASVAALCFGKEEATCTVAWQKYPAHNGQPTSYNFGASCTNGATCHKHTKTTYPWGKKGKKEIVTTGFTCNNADKCVVKTGIAVTCPGAKKCIASNGGQCTNPQTSAPSTLPNTF